MHTLTTSIGTSGIIDASQVGRLYLSRISYAKTFIIICLHVPTRDASRVYLYYTTVYMIYILTLLCTKYFFDTKMYLKYQTVILLSNILYIISFISQYHNTNNVKYDDTYKKE